LSALLAVLLLALAGCANPLAPQSTPTAITPPPRPAVIATPSPVPPDLGDDPEDTLAVFEDQLLTVIDQASVMAEAPCDDLKRAQTDDPNVFRSIRGYAATLKKVASQSPDMAQDPEIASALADLDTVMGQLDGALSLCGISTT
jgi:hypothetical protein